MRAAGQLGPSTTGMSANLCQTSSVPLLARFVSGTEWSQFADYLSPSFFDVVPARALRRVLGSLTATSLRPRRVRAAKAERDQTLREAGLPLTLDPARRHPPRAGLATGDVILSLYFHQLEHGPTALLDLRSTSFSSADGQLLWEPAGLVHAWAPGIREALSRLYRGYYGGDDAMFEAALRELALEPAREVFLAQFGTGDQRAVRFEMRKFHDSFHEAFVVCRDAGVELDGDFIALGIYLATLYEHLEALGGEWDVRAAWQRACG